MNHKKFCLLVSLFLYFVCLCVIVAVFYGKTVITTIFSRIITIIKYTMMKIT